MNVLQYLRKIFPFVFVYVLMTVIISGFWIEVIKTSDLKDLISFVSVFLYVEYVVFFLCLILCGCDGLEL
jgi:hypothetical protein